ncbi:MAG: hotdog fold thioesterase [Bacteroidaceae bacterium]|nr:hotdog fold thioesterase [Bacteroidaceae bacterium]
MGLIDFFRKDRFASDAGCVLTVLSEGRATATMTVGPQHLNAGGVCQGGALFTLADLAFAGAVNSHGQLSFSINSTIHIIASAREGDVLTAVATELVNHPKIPFCEVRISNQDGVLIATFSGQAYRKNAHIPVTD